ncbi:MAG TPA: response regulator [Candidatus Pristimantibacillus sp.]|nr:response regulator [Candidatus Pristimantibacillus sp.]
MSHILLLEPNTLLAGVYTQALTHVGHSVAHVTGAQAAIDAADKKKPDLVITELQLPQHSGIEFLHEFRSYAEWLKLPVVLNTALTAEQIAPVMQALHRDLGIREILYKPRASLQDLVRVAREYVLPA